MNGKKIVLLAIGLTFFIFSLFNLLRVQDVHTPAGLIVKVLDVGQGDAILIRSGKDNVLIDSGDTKTRNRLINLLEKEGIKEFSLVVATHPHADHIGGMTAVLDRFPVKKILDSGQVHTTRVFTDYLKKAHDKKIQFNKAKTGDRYQLDQGAYLEVLWPGKEFLQGTGSDLNNNSVVLRLVNGNFSMLLTGDIERAAEHELVNNAEGKIRSVVLKSPHHASNTSSTGSFLRTVGAKAVIISCGKNNDYGFPKPEVLRRYRELNMDVYITADDGTITVYSDGNGYKIVKEKN